MGKKLPHTPYSQIYGAIRRYVWLRSRERAAALKRDNYTCQCCGKKQSRAKGKEVYVEVHHRKGIVWRQIIDFIRKELLVNVGDLQTLCKECHKNEGNTKG